MSFLVEQNQPLLLAVSGGIDSMVLLHLLMQTDFDFAVAHCNFQLRPESTAEAVLVATFCEENNITFHLKEINTREEVAQSNESTQMAARRLRYDFFDSLRKKYGYQYIVTAHHANDNLETVLLNLTKGTGIRGLVGIAEKTSQLLRPLLTFTKQEIKDYALSNSIPFLEDATNSENNYQRNLIRNEVIPILAQINPEVVPSSIRSIENFKFTKRLFDQRLVVKKKKILHQFDSYQVIYKKQLFSQQSSWQFFFEVLSDFGFITHQIESLYHLLSSDRVEPSKIYHSNSHSALVDNKERLLISQLEIQSENIYQLDSVNQTIDFFERKIKIEEVAKPNEFSAKPNEIYVDVEQLHFPLQIRKWLAGDYFYPFGLGKKQKISKFLINEKVNKIEKEKQYLLTSGQKVVWVISRRMDERFKVKPNTKEVARIILL